MRSSILLVLASGCAAPLTPDALVLIDGSAREAGVHVVSDGQVLTGSLPMAVPGGQPLEVVTADGSATLDPVADEVVDLRGPEAEVVWRRIGDDIDADALWVGGELYALEDLAWELDADLTWEDGDARLEGEQVLIDAARVVPPDALDWSQASSFVGREAVRAPDATTGSDADQGDVTGDASRPSLSGWIADQLDAVRRSERTTVEEPRPQVDPDWLSRAPGGTGWIDLETGTGRILQGPTRIQVHYTMWVDDDGVKDGSRRRGRPATFPWRQGSLIEGWEEGLMGMREGGRRILVVPPEAGYGPNGRPGLIGPDSILTFEVELLSILEFTL